MRSITNVNVKRDKVTKITKFVSMGNEKSKLTKNCLLF